MEGAEGPHLEGQDDQDDEEDDAPSVRLDDSVRCDHVPRGAVAHRRFAVRCGRRGVGGGGEGEQRHYGSGRMRGVMNGGGEGPCTDSRVSRQAAVVVCLGVVDGAQGREREG